MKKQTNTAEKAYSKCIDCSHRRVRCRGISPSGMPLDLWCEYMRDMKHVNKLTNAEISDQSGVSLKTVEKIMALNSEQDFMRDTARRIESVILGSEGDCPCYLAFQQETTSDDKNLSDVLHELARVQAELETVKAEAQKKIEYLLNDVARLRAANDNLWAENIRKSKIVDLYIDKQIKGS